MIFCTFIYVIIPLPIPRIKTFVFFPSGLEQWAWGREASVQSAGFPYGWWRVVKGRAGSLLKGCEGACSCGGSLCDAPLAARALDDKGGGVALVAGVKVTLTAALGRLEVVSRTAQKVLPKILEKVPGEAHIDPRVTAAVEAGQQHGDDEGHGCRRREGERKVTMCRNDKNQPAACFSLRYNLHSHGSHFPLKLQWTSIPGSQLNTICIILLLWDWLATEDLFSDLPHPYFVLRSNPRIVAANAVRLKCLMFNIQSTAGQECVRSIVTVSATQN